MALWDKLGGKGSVDDRRGIGPVGIGSGIIASIITIALGYAGIAADPAIVEQLVDASGVLPQTEQSNEFAGNDSYESFARNVLGSADTYWTQELARTHAYEPPTLVLFRDKTSSACGQASAEMGPHYCPADQHIYLDERFFEILTERYGAEGGDVAQAYVIAHEVGHHVQHVTGTLASVQSNPNYQNTGPSSPSVRVELQADCYAGLWAHSIKGQGVFETDTEIQEAIDAAAAVGDDRIQSSSGSIHPETWTHGSSEQRVDAFTTGWLTGDRAQCRL